MFGLSPWEILVILLIAVLLFGKRLPEIGSSLGKAITNFKNSTGNSSIENDSKKLDYECKECEVERDEDKIKTK